MTQEIFDNGVKLFKERYIIKSSNSPENSYKKSQEQIEFLNMGLEVDTKNPWTWIIDFFEMTKKIISYFDGINENWCKKYNEDRINFPDKPTDWPTIFIDFRDYVENLMNENYIECSKLKDRIFISY